MTGPASCFKSCLAACVTGLDPYCLPGGLPAQFAAAAQKLSSLAVYNVTDYIPSIINTVKRRDMHTEWIGFSVRFQTGFGVQSSSVDPPSAQEHCTCWPLSTTSPPTPATSCISMIYPLAWKLFTRTANQIDHWKVYNHGLLGLRKD